MKRASTCAGAARDQAQPKERRSRLMRSCGCRSRRRGYLWRALFSTDRRSWAPTHFLLIGVRVSAVMGVLWVTVCGHLSDRVGRKNMYMIGMIVRRHIRVHLFRPARYPGAGIDISRGRAVNEPIMTSLRYRGGTDSRKVLPRLCVTVAARCANSSPSIIAGGPAPLSLLRVDTYIIRPCDRTSISSVARYRNVSTRC